MRAKSFNHGASAANNRHNLEHRSSKDDIQVGISFAAFSFFLFLVNRILNSAITLIFLIDVLKFF